jgi:hypothetical protein
MHPRRLSNRAKLLRLVVPTALAVAALVVGVTTPVASAAATKSTTIEALGPPTQGFDGGTVGSACYGYKTVGQGAKIAIGNMTFYRGFEVITQNLFGYNCQGAWTWTWHLGGSYRSFRAWVGLPVGVTTATDLAFLSAQGATLPFNADGHLVHKITLVAGQPTNLSMKVSGLLNLVIRTTTPAVTIAFANDALAA